MQTPLTGAETQGVTLPRRVLPNRTYLITRRCSERRFFLRPDRSVTGIFEYLLGHACDRYGIELHGFVCMSNHYHLVVTDRHGVLPDFQRYLNSLLARAVNATRGRWEAFWSRESYNAVDLLEDGDVIDKLAYTLVNPVRAGLVGRASDWGGASSAKMRFGHRRRVARPAKFFSEGMPEYSRIELRPPAHVGGRLDELQDELARRVRAVEVEVRGRGRKPMGMRAVLSQDWKDSPKTRALRRQLIPKLAARCTAVRVAAIAEYRRWVEDYRAALASFKQGVRGVEWPSGTYWMSARLGCPRVAA